MLLLQEEKSHRKMFEEVIWREKTGGKIIHLNIGCLEMATLA